MSESIHQEREEILILSPHFRVTHFTCPLVVAFVPLASVPRCAWWLLREFSSSHPLSSSSANLKDPQSNCTVRSILLDDEGLTIIFPLSRLGSLPSLLSKDDLNILFSQEKKPEDEGANECQDDKKLMSSISYQQLMCPSISSQQLSSPQPITTPSSLQQDSPTLSEAFSWRAFTVRMSGPSFDTPQVILSLTQSLSQNGISILHISTFEAEVYLVPRDRVGEAKKIFEDYSIKLFKTHLGCGSVQEEENELEILESCDNLEQDLRSPGLQIEGSIGMDIDEDEEQVGSLFFELEDMNFELKDSEKLKTETGGQTTSSSPISLGNTVGNMNSSSQELLGLSTHLSYPALDSLPVEDEEEESGEDDLDENWITSHTNNNFPSSTPHSVSSEHNLPAIDTSSSVDTRFQSDYTLSVLPHPVILATLTHPMYYSVCTQIMVNILLYDERFSVLERECQKLETPKAGISNNNHSRFLWGIWQCGEEVTFLLEESDLSLFPVDVLLLSPIQWRVIKLCGPAIEGSECGIVAAMMKPLTSDFQVISSPISSSIQKNSSSILNSSNNINKIISLNNFNSPNNNFNSINNSNMKGSFNSLSSSVSHNCLENSNSNNFNINSSIDHNFNNYVSESIPSLNISTAITNSTLVPEELLYQTVVKLSLYLFCKAYFSPIC